MKHKTILRVRTSYWHDDNGLYIRKTLSFLKRKSEGLNFILEDSSQVGADETIPKINNLNEVEDGLYEIVVDNDMKDWETGYIEDWEYRLIPYKEESV